MTTPATVPIALTRHNLKVLLLDDQRIVGETIRLMLHDIPNLEFLFCAEPAVALSQASDSSLSRTPGAFRCFPAAGPDTLPDPRPCSTETAAHFRAALHGAQLRQLPPARIVPCL